MSDPQTSRGRAARLGLRIAASCLVLLSASACGPYGAEALLLARGPGHSFAPSQINTYANDQDRVLESIRRIAGLEQDPVSPDDWRRFVVAGFEYADARCEDYMSALRQLDVVRRQATTQTTLIGTATAGILGIAQATSAAIAITGIAFGLAGATIDNVAGGLLYELPPSTVRGLIERLRQTYEDALTSADWQDRPSAFRTIRGYVELCLPAVIEAHVASAVSVATPEAVSRRGPPRLRMVDAVSFSATEGNDESAAALRRIWRPNGRDIDPAGQRRIREAMNDLGLSGISLTTVIESRELRSARRQILNRLSR